MARDVMAGTHLADLRFFLGAALGRTRAAGPEPASGGRIERRRDLAPDAASAFRMEPPAFQLHAWKEGVGVVSHTAYIGDFAGPYPFYEGDELIE